ncbi:hypothetical protein BKI52_24840 [marine bacterium AO1-C]|nr:hypothetical protein BKI52_24840 [marine bacterium AO1-C]
MSMLKAKFGKYKISTKELQTIQGGKSLVRCPDKLKPAGECEKYWGDDKEGLRRCRATCGHEIYPGPWK